MKVFNYFSKIILISGRNENLTSLHYELYSIGPKILPEVHLNIYQGFPKAFKFLSLFDGAKLQITEKGFYQKGFFENLKSRAGGFSQRLAFFSVEHGRHGHAVRWRQVGRALAPYHDLVRRLDMFKDPLCVLDIVGR